MYSPADHYALSDRPLFAIERLLLFRRVRCKATMHSHLPCHSCFLHLFSVCRSLISADLCQTLSFSNRSSDDFVSRSLKRGFLWAGLSLLCAHLFCKPSLSIRFSIELCSTVYPVYSSRDGMKGKLVALMVLLDTIVFLSLIHI